MKNNLTAWPKVGISKVRVSWVLDDFRAMCSHECNNF
jgi:hypothetical protein